MSTEQIKEILEKHKLWRRGDPSGSRANLTDAYLTGADLARANLTDAYLTGANLTDAYLTGADLARADLTGADLTGADLAGADLTGADLTGARSVPSGTEKTDPPEPYKRAVTHEDYVTRAERYRESHPAVPVVPDLDRRILEAIEAPGCSLNMGNWHTCETTHCRAGWAIHLAGEAGYKLEREYGSSAAARMIYLASTGRTAYFYSSSERAMEDIRRRAAEQASD